MDLSTQNVLVDTHRIVVVEGVDTRVHLVDQHAQRPPVDGLSVTLVEDYFRCNVLGRSADGKGAALIEHLREAEVRELEVAVVTDQQIFGLEVSEDDVLGMQIFEATGDRSTIKSRIRGDGTWPARWGRSRRSGGR